MGKSSVISDDLALAAARATIAAAIASARWVGRGDEYAADLAAVDALRAALNAIAIKGRVVVSEGDRDSAPMLEIDEEVGLGEGPEFDVALDPLEGTTLAAKAAPNALSVLALAPRCGLLHAPDIYMDKIAIGPGYAADLIDLDAPADENVRALAKAKGVAPREIGVCVLDRPRHTPIIDALREVGARVVLIPEGDVAGVIQAARPETGVDMYIGRGGAPEGVLAAAALRCVGGQFQGRLAFRSDEEKAKAERAGVSDLKKRYALDDLVGADAAFVATGVTSGLLLDGVRFEGGFVHTHTLVLNAATQLAANLRVKLPAPG